MNSTWRRSLSGAAKYCFMSARALRLRLAVLREAVLDALQFASSGCRRGPRSATVLRVGSPAYRGSWRYGPVPAPVNQTAYFSRDRTARGAAENSGHGPGHRQWSLVGGQCCQLPGQGMPTILAAFPLPPPKRTTRVRPT